MQAEKLAVHIKIEFSYACTTTSTTPSRVLTSHQKSKQAKHEVIILRASNTLQVRLPDPEEMSLYLITFN